VNALGNTNQEHHVTVYHDETKSAGPDNYRGHILFFVPRYLAISNKNSLFSTSLYESNPSKMLYEKIMEIRKTANQEDHKLHFSKGLSGRRWTKRHECYRLVIEAAVEALYTKGNISFPQPLCCKLAVIFYPKSVDLTLYGGPDKKEKQLRLDETILRILLKGAVHYLYRESTPVVIECVISDGFPNHRALDNERVILPLLYDRNQNQIPIQDHVTFNENAGIIPLLSDHKKHTLGTPEYMHAIILQVSDLILGSVIESCLKGVGEFAKSPEIGRYDIPTKQVAAYPVKEMIMKKEKRKSGFKHSGHYGTFTVSSLEFKRGNFIFNELTIKSISSSSNQLEIYFK